MSPGTVPRASAAETAGVLSDVAIPLFTRGAVVRRPRVEGLLDRLDADRRSVRRLQRLRQRHGEGPVLLPLPGRKVALVLSHGHVHRVLHEAPEPFAPASFEKRAALSHFQPHGVLISRGAARSERRRFNERVLETGRPVHGLGDELMAKVREEALAMLDGARHAGQLGWEGFAQGWWALIRRLVLGDGARDDQAVTDLLASLRATANWAFLRPKRRAVRDRFLGLLEAHLSRGEPGSLAGRTAEARSPKSAPASQVAHWLFAFDAAGMATFRTLALLDAHQRAAETARDEVAGRNRELPFLRACVLESLRLWPTTPAILRETTEQTAWESGTLPAGATVLVFAPFFHRDSDRLAFADAFSPELWLGDGPGRWALVPFSAGLAGCPGRDLVLLTTSSLLAVLTAGGRLAQTGPRKLDPSAPMPATLSPFRLSFEVRGDQPSGSRSRVPPGSTSSS